MNDAHRAVLRPRPTTSTWGRMFYQGGARLDRRAVAAGLDLLHRAVSCSGQNPADPVCSSFSGGGLAVAFCTPANMELVREGVSPPGARGEGLPSYPQPGATSSTTAITATGAGPELRLRTDARAPRRARRRTPGEFHVHRLFLLQLHAAYKNSRDALGDAGPPPKKYRALGEKGARGDAEQVVRTRRPAGWQTGSQGCQAFALWLDFAARRGAARGPARIMRDDPGELGATA